MTLSEAMGKKACLLLAVVWADAPLRMWPFPGTRPHEGPSQLTGTPGWGPGLGLRVCRFPQMTPLPPLAASLLLSVKLDLLPKFSRAAPSWPGRPAAPSTGPEH